MADVITSQPQSVAVAAAPQWGVATRKYAVEAIGAFFLTFAVGVAALSGSVFVPLAAGAMLMVMIYAGGHISGGHYNPAVTLAVLIRRKITNNEATIYMGSQLAGGLIAALIVGIFREFPSESGQQLVITKALLAEVLGTFALAYVILNVA